MSDTSQVERQMFILNLLSDNHQGFTRDEILSRLDNMGMPVSKKTVERDLDAISTNFQVSECERYGQTYYKADKYNLKKIDFTVIEMLSLHFAREVMRSYSSIDVGMAAGTILDRIIASTPSIDRKYINTLSDMLKINLAAGIPECTIAPDMRNKIQNAIADRKCLNIEYYSFNSNEITKRRIEPYLLEIYEGHWHVVGYCHLRDRISDFRISRIQDIEILETCFERPKDFYEKYIAKRFDKLAGEEKISLRVRFTGHSARYVKEYEAFRADKIEDNKDGSIIFKKNATTTPEIRNWILKYGSEAEVLEPQELREEIAIEARKLMEIYRK